MRIKYRIVYGDGGHEYVEVTAASVNSGFNSVLVLEYQRGDRELNRIEFWEVLAEPKYYVANVFGWMTIIEASHLPEAVLIAKQRAPGASLLKSDVNASHVREATAEERAWYLAMGGEVQDD